MDLKDYRQPTKWLGILFFLMISISATYFHPVNLIPKHFPKPITALPDIKKDSFKIYVGRLLFYDPILSKDNSISCASCHTSYNAFAHTDHALSHGIHDSIGIRNAPALFNLAWQKNFMWDGAVQPLQMQALAPINHPGEMGENLESVLKKLNKSLRYKIAFKQAYNDSTIKTNMLLDALAMFELSLTSTNAKYDRVKQGLDTFSITEQKGYETFKRHCQSCHPEPLFFKNEFENNGLSPDKQLKDLGRFSITLEPKDSFKFKIPSLRNLAYSYPYMHDGRFKKLSEVLQHYQNGGQNSGQMNDDIKKGVSFSSNQKVELLAFLQTLNDKAFVFKPSHQFPKELLDKAKD